MSFSNITWCIRCLSPKLCQIGQFIRFYWQPKINQLAAVFMMTSSNGNIFRVTGPLCGEFTGPGEFPSQRPVTRSFDVFFDLRPNKRLSKQPWGWWFETPSWSLWRQCNVNCKHIFIFRCKMAKVLNQVTYEVCELEVINDMTGLWMLWLMACEVSYDMPNHSYDIKDFDKNCDRVATYI